MSKSMIGIGGLIACLCLLGCDSGMSSNTDAARDTEFTVILHQLEATRNDIRALKEDVAKMSGDFDAFKIRSFAQAPSAPVQPAQLVTLRLDEEAIILGDSNAKIAIVEFTDYQCSYCVRFHSSAFSEIKKNYIDTGKVRYVVRDFPLDIHAEGESAAVAVNCAGKQGKYWEMRDQLFANQRSLGPALYARLATQLMLDEGSFSNCSKQGEIAKKVQRDFAYGQSIGVSGTPNFFVGRIAGTQVVDAKQITGAQPYRSFSNAIDSLLN